MATTSQKKVLLITNDLESSWNLSVRKAVSAVGNLTMVKENLGLLNLRRSIFHLVIIDAAEVEDILSIVSQIHTQYPTIPILVATLSRSWKRAREAIRAGATDYIFKSRAIKDLAFVFLEMIDRANVQKEKPDLLHEVSRSRATILIAENHPELLITTKEFFEAKGYRVITATNPTEAKKKLNVGGIDLAVLDIRLENDDDEKDLSGLLIAKSVAPEIPKIIVTSFPSYDYVREGLRPQLDGDHSVVDFISRDEGLTILLQSVEDVIESVMLEKKGRGTKQKVFIAHGHDIELKDSVASFLKGIGLDPIILSETSGMGDTVIEKFERYSRDARFAVALFTPDDLGYPKNYPTEVKSRARQNVIFELGYLFAKLGRRRVRVLYRGVEIPTDILGIVYIEIDEKYKWQQYLFREIKDAGISVNELGLR